MMAQCLGKHINFISSTSCHKFTVLRRVLVVISVGVRLHLLCVATDLRIPHVDHSAGVITVMRRLTT